MPRFSIIITSYNQRSFIREAVNSALAQEYSEKEVIVVDDGSTDGSPAILAEYGNRIKAFYLGVNQGAYSARNKGVSLANGDYVMFLDGDDLLLPWALRAYSKIIDLKKPKLVIARLLHCLDGTTIKDKLSKTPNEIEIVEYETLMKKDRNVRFSPTAVMERKCFNHSGGWAADMFHLDDHDLLLRMGYSGKTVHILSPFTVVYRQHETNVSKQLDQMLDGILKIIRREKADVYPGGKDCRLERYAAIGGFAFYWLKRGFKANYYAAGLRLLAAGWFMISIAIFRRGAILTLGKRPKEIIPFA